jgi:hypothetical protein
VVAVAGVLALGVSTVLAASAPARPPTPTITSGPSGPTNTKSATFTFKDSQAGVTFKCALDNGAFAACTSPRSYSGLAEGSHTFRVFVQAAVGSPSDTAARTWTVDTVPPAKPVLTTMPKNPTFDDEAEFEWRAGEPSGTFRCKLDGGPFGTCPDGDRDGDGADYEHLAAGDHCFYVKAVDAAGNESAVVSFCWTIQLKSSSGFTISGGVPPFSPLAPGVTRTMQLTITNPQTFAIKVTGISISNITNSSSRCSAANLLVAQPFTGSVVVPKNSTAPVPAAQAPQVQMPDLATNQDACKNTTFNFTFSGTATQA